MLREVTLWPDPAVTRNCQHTTGERIPLKQWMTYLESLAIQLTEEELASATIVPGPAPIRYTKRVSDAEVAAYRVRLVNDLLPRLKSGGVDERALAAFEQEWVTLSRLGA